MAEHWTDDQQYLLNAIEEYRNLLIDIEQKEARIKTNEFAKQLHRNTPELKHRTTQSIAERLPYLDNLLAGVFEKENYAIKDQSLYATIPRENNDITFNASNTRHSYNGAIR